MSIRPIFLVLAALILADIGFAASSSGARRPDLKRRPGAVIYKLKPGTTAREASTLAEFRKNRASLEVKDLGAGLLLERFDAGGVSEEELADRIHASGAVEFAEPDYLVSPAFVPNDTLYSSSWHLPKINAPGAWDIATGTNVTIAILDTGVDPTHPDLAARLVAGWNVVDNNSNTNDVNDHGTWVAGTAAAIGNNAVGITGVAWSARIMPIRIANAGGYASYSDMATGIYYAATHGARVANLSYNDSCTAQTIIDAAKSLRTYKGILVVAAGNSAEQISGSASSDLTCVSATNSSDIRSSFSNFGASVDVSAPGEAIWATKWTGGYEQVSGTSFSSPITAGVYALMISINPLLSSSQLDTMLFNSAHDLGASGKDIYYGYGRVDAKAAADLASASADTVPPSVSITAPANGASVGGTVTLSAGASDNVGIGGVQFRVDGSNQGNEDVVSPYSISWNTLSLADGPHTVSAVARDAIGLTASASTITVTVDNTAPALSNVTVGSILASGGTISWTTNEPATSHIDYGPTSAYGYSTTLDGSLDTSHAQSITGLQPLSTYHYRVKSRDEAGNLSLSGDGTFDTIADVIPPTAVVASPGPAAQSGSVIIVSTADDNVAVARVKFYVDGVDTGAEDTSAPYQFFWNTARWDNGSHTLTAVAIDTSGNQTVSAGVTVDVQNTEATLHPPLETFAYPDPALSGATPTFRVFMEEADLFQVTVYDASGRAVDSAEYPASPSGVTDGRLYFDIPCPSGLASGRYFALVRGISGGTKAVVKTPFRIVR